jgi:hypothetical protein
MLRSNLACGSGDGTVFVRTVPEPSVLTLLGTRALGLSGFAWRRRRAFERPAEVLQQVEVPETPAIALFPCSPAAAVPAVAGYLLPRANGDAATTYYCK